MQRSERTRNSWTHALRDLVFQMGETQEANGLASPTSQLQLQIRMENPPPEILARRAAGRAYYQANKSRYANNQRAFRAANPDTFKAQWERNNHKRRLRLHGLSPAEYDKMHLAQNGKCAICLKSPGEKGLSIDHCHKTKVVRGLLCSNCNTAIGLLKDSAGSLFRATLYVELHARATQPDYVAS